MIFMFLLECGKLGLQRWIVKFSIFQKEVCWGHVVYSRMWSMVIIVVLPLFYNFPGIHQSWKVIDIQYFLSHCSVKALNQCIFCWLAWCNEIQLNVIVFAKGF